MTFPAYLRDRLCAAVPGAQLEITEREDGVFEMRPVVPIPADQQWFWKDPWQSMEVEAFADIHASRVARFDNVEDFLADLDA